MLFPSGAKFVAILATELALVGGCFFDTQLAPYIDLNMSAWVHLLE
jgi:hypothetical protein